MHQVPPAEILDSNVIGGQSLAGMFITMANYLIHAAKSADLEVAKPLQDSLGPNWKLHHGAGIRKALGCSQGLLSDVQNHGRN